METFPMLAKHKYKVEGAIRVGASKGFYFKNREYCFESDDDGYLSSICVTVPISIADVPRVEEMPGKPPHIIVPSASAASAVREELYTLEGLLSLLGLQQIGFSQPEMEWIAESEEDEAALQIHRVSVGKTDSRERMKEEIEFSMIAQNVIAASELKDTQVALSFFRKGQNNIEQERYISAIYEFYFVFEHLFADGKFKSNQVKEKFRSSKSLILAIEEGRKQFAASFSNPQERAYYKTTYLHAPNYDVIDHLVDLRGRLHHHSKASSTQNWHPSRESEYRIDASFCHAMALSACFKLTSDRVYNSEIAARCQSLKGFYVMPDDD